MVYWVLARKVIPTVLPPQGEAVSASPLSANMVKLPEPLHTLNRNIPVELSHLVQECVQLNPQDRVQGMGQVAERLESLAGSLGDTHMGLKAVGA